MLHLKNYHRPAELTEALRLLAQSEVKTVPLAGGTFLNPHLDAQIEAVVDLQALGLDGIDYDAGSLTLGAMTRLQSIIDHPQAPPLLKAMAQREGPNTFRHAATIGGVVAGADMESELLAALLVFGATITIETTTGSQAIPLTSLPVALNGGLITAITLPTSGQTAAERVARTPADKPIVAVVGRKDSAGKIHLALCGVAPTPVLADSANPTANLTPPDDFRGSSAYRLAMVEVLAERVVRKLEN